MNIQTLLNNLDVNPALFCEGDLQVYSPVEQQLIGTVKKHTEEQVDRCIELSVEAFKHWRLVPAPKRGELLRIFGNKLRKNKQSLGALVTLECGKILQEGLGEVQEMIDICDFAIGLSRQLYGLTIVSERPGHKMNEYWQPLGPVGIISAFNFPVAVWSWNAALALVCGNSIIWKPSEKTPITALVCQSLFSQACEEFGEAPKGLSQVLIGASKEGEALVNDVRVPVISATGSTAMGRKVGPAVAARFGRSILELGGNNAIIVASSADMTMALQGIVFGAVGTAGQRCTSTRRLFIHESIYPMMMSALMSTYQGITVGDPMEESSLVGPLIDRQAYEAMQQALSQAKELGGKVQGGQRIRLDDKPDAYYVQPSLVEMPSGKQTIQEETFAPILYVYSYSDLDEAIGWQNDVPQGLSSALFTTDLREAEYFTSAVGSDCGIANINIGTSGAEIGGAFGGEKETGGGRESGSDAWKGYMRRTTSTTNYSRELPLAQGIKFDI